MKGRHDKIPIPLRFTCHAGVALLFQTPVAKQHLI